MTRKPLTRIISLIAKAAAPATAVATSLAAPLAQAASGDLDPSFADHGRVGPVATLKGSAYAVDAMEDGGALFAGSIVERECRFSGWYCWYDYEYVASNFVSALTEDGALDASYDGAQSGNIEVVDIARQPDGKVVAAGRRLTGFRGYPSHLVVFRLESDGSLDPGFGTEGIVELDVDATEAINHGASALLVEPDGRIVVAGTHDGDLIVLRLDPNGSLDSSFADGGMFTDPGHGSNNRIARLASGGYRLTVSYEGSCRVLGLTVGGALDLTFGQAGYAKLATGLGGIKTCHSIAAQDDGRLVIAGVDDGKAFAVRLLANGAPDTHFSAPEVTARVVEATAVAIADDGKILVGGDGVSGATVMRLQASGQLDAPFGDAGATLIDLPSRTVAQGIIRDIDVRADGSVIAAGGAYDSNGLRPFAIRLLGDGGGDSAGVISITQSYVDASESGDAVITVRRSGGKSGPVSVNYGTADDAAVGGQDYEAVSGQLHWADGESGERSIVVPVLADSGAGEEYEYFNVSLSKAQGGAGLGARDATVTIGPDGAPAGQFSIEADTDTYEGATVQFWLYRNFYSEGTVCVTLTPESGSAIEGDDFEAAAAQYCWGDQDAEAKLVEIPIVNDTETEDSETFSVQLSDPTGGAVIGPRGSATFSIHASDPVQPEQGGGNGGGGGGGAAGFLTLLLLGLTEALRAARRWIRKPA